MFFKNRYKQMLIALSPLYGVILYAAHLYVKYGDPLLFYRQQSVFGANRSVDKIILLPQVLYRYIKILLFSDKTFQYFIALVEFGIYILVISVVTFELFRIIRAGWRKHKHEFAIQVYSLSVILLPTLTGTLTSTPRYMLLAFGFFIALAKIKNKFVKIAISSGFFILQTTLFFYFLKGYFIS